MIVSLLSRILLPLTGRSSALFGRVDACEVLGQNLLRRLEEAEEAIGEIRSRESARVHRLERVVEGLIAAKEVQNLVLIELLRHAGLAMRFDDDGGYIGVGSVPKPRKPRAPKKK